MHGRMDAWTHGCLMHECTNALPAGRMDGWMDGWIDGETDGWRDVRTDGSIYSMSE